jgi:glycosyltransferase involved in cell wall biosynthesis
MTLGAVVPVYNRRANLEILLASLEKQTDDDFVLVVVDDGCTDGTDQLLEQVAATPFWQDRLRVVKAGPHQGIRIGRARNIGAANLPAGVTSMVMLDSDLVLQPDAFDKISELTRSHPDSVLLGPVHWLPRLAHDEVRAEVDAGRIAELRDSALILDSEAPVPMPDQDEGTLVGPEIRFSLFGGVAPVDPEEPVAVRPYWVIPPNSVWPVGTFWQLGGFDEELHGYGEHDFALGVRMEQAGVYVLARPELWALHLWHPKDTTSSDRQPVDLAAKVEEHGMAAQVFMMVRRGEWNLDAVTS